MDIAGLLRVDIRAPTTNLDADFAAAENKARSFDQTASRALHGVDTAAKKTGQSIQGMATQAAVANDNLRVMGTTSRVAALGLREIVAAGTTFGAATLAAFSIKPVFAFKDAIAGVSTLVDTSTFDMKRLEQSALSLAKAFGGGPVAQVQAFNDVISSGIEDLGRATQVVTTANQLAVGGATSVQTATNGLTSVLNAYGDKVKSVQDISDAIFISMRDGKSTIDELSGSLGRVAPIAAQTNVSFDELTAAIAALTLGGISTEEAVTGVRAMLVAIAKPSDEAAKLAAQLGLQFNSAALKSKGFASFLDDVITKTHGSTDQLSLLFGSVQAIIPAMALAGTAGDAFSETMDHMRGKAGATQEAFDKMANSPGFQAGRIWSSLVAEVTEAGGALDALVPVMKLVADNMHLIVTAVELFAAAQIVSLIGPMITGFYALAESMGVAAAAAGALDAAMAFVGGPIGLAVIALGGAYLLLRDNVSAAAQATIDAKAAYEGHIGFLNDSKAASEGYTAALRNQIAMQVEATRAAADAATDAAIAASARRASFEALTGLKFSPLVSAENAADTEAATLDASLLKLEGQLARVDANLRKTDSSGTAASATLGKVDKAAQRANKAYDSIIDRAHEFIAGQQLEASSLGKTREETNRLTYEQDLLNEAARAHIALTPKQTAELKSLAAEMAHDEEQTTRLKEAFDFARETTKGFFSDIASGLENGKGLWASFADAAVNALGKIADKLIESGVDQLFSGSSGSGIAGFLGKLLGLGGAGGGFSAWDSAVADLGQGLFDRGGYTGPGGVNQPKGIVHAGEIVWSQRDVANAGGVAAAEGLRRSIGGYAGGGVVGGNVVLPKGQSGAANNNHPMAVNLNFAPTMNMPNAAPGAGDEVKKALKTFADQEMMPRVVKAIREAKIQGVM